MDLTRRKALATIGGLIATIGAGTTVADDSDNDSDDETKAERFRENAVRFREKADRAREKGKDDKADRFEEKADGFAEKAQDAERDLEDSDEDEDDSDADDEDSENSEDDDNDEDADEDEGQQDGGTVVVDVRDDAEYGEILVTTDDFALYAFSEDSLSGKSSACTTDLRENENSEALAELSCTTKWPPLTEDDPAGSDEVTARIESFDRDDPDGHQVSADNEPLYANVQDTPGTVNGPRNESGGVWFLLSPSGETLDVLD